MNTLFCSQCGSKSSNGARFCFSCGSALTVLAANKTSTNHIPKNDSVESASDEVFNKPYKLDYEIQKDGNNIYKAEDIVKSTPVEEKDRFKRPSQKTKSVTKEELLAQSLKECASSKMNVIE